jgi:transposase-like protein
MARQSYTPEQKAEALALVAEHGHSEAVRRTGIPMGTIASWANREDVKAPDPGITAAKTTALIASTAERKQQIAAALLEDADRLRRQLFAPCTDKVVKVVSGGQMREGRVEIVEVQRDQPTFADQKNIVAATSQAIEKALLMLGEATERVEQLLSDGTQRTPEVEAKVAEVLTLVRSNAA